jgi:hypothetical protein
MAKTKTTGKQTDNKIMDMIALVKTKKAEIAKAERPNFKTNCSFSYAHAPIQTQSTNASVINLHAVSDIRVLTSIAGFLTTWETTYRNGAAALSIDDCPKFVWDGYTVDEWLHDIKIRITKIQIADKKKKLEELENRLDKIISPELRAQMELEAIEAELK